MGLLDDRVVVVTGGARGIGFAAAAACVAHGAEVVIADIAGAEPAARRLGGLGVATDVADERQVQAMVAAAIERHGRIDGLVNNAALVAGVERGPFEAITPSDWDRMLAVNLRGTWACTKAVAPQMRDRRYGKVVNVASDLTLSGVGGLAHYTASKGGVVALTRALASELGECNVTVNAIAPGLTETPAALAHAGDASRRAVAGRAIARRQTPEDVVGTVVFLLSSLSDFVTGQLIAVNGGYVF